MVDDAASLIGAHFGGGRYEVLAVLGGGGMGAVYRARETATDTEVALKVLHDRLAAEDTHLARFRREAEVASALSHPNVVQVLDHGAEPNGTPWLIMEFLGGETLSKLGGREAPLDVPRAVRIGRQIAYALAAVHDVGVVHRDLKPGNVMVARRGEAEEVKVVDFGLARFFGSKAFERLTFTGQVVGTPSYMAPEQAFGGAVDERTDVYALGAIIYALLTGHAPHGRGGYQEVLTRLLGGDRVPLYESHPHLGRVTEVVERCLAFDPAERYASMKELDAALASLDPSPTTTLVDWVPPARLQALRLRPDPILDAVPEVAQTAFLRAAQGRGAAGAPTGAHGRVPAPSAAGVVAPPGVGPASTATAGPSQARSRWVIPLVAAGMIVTIAVVAAVAFTVGQGSGPGAGELDPVANSGGGATGDGVLGVAPVIPVSPVSPVAAMAATRDPAAEAPETGAADVPPSPAATTTTARGMRAPRRTGRQGGRAAEPQDSDELAGSAGAADRAPPGAGPRRRMTLTVERPGAWTEAEIRRAFAPGLRRGTTCASALVDPGPLPQADIADFLFHTNGEAQSTGLTPVDRNGSTDGLRRCTRTTIEGIRMPPRNAPHRERFVDVRLTMVEVTAP